MSKELVIFCDESDGKGAYYSNFYGGVLVRSSALARVEQALQQKKVELNLHSEIKWTKITENYEAKYKELLTLFFEFVQAGDVKVRIMFTQNCFEPIHLTREQRENSYLLLYYQFIKHAFGLRYYAETENSPYKTRLRINFDQLPETSERRSQFKDFIARLSHSTDFKAGGVFVTAQDLCEIDSKHHVILQCLDVVLGAMSFRLNDKHLEIPAGEKRRGKRTLAKERVYGHINHLIQLIRPRFNIGVSTGGGASDRWRGGYRHWNFKPDGSVFNPDRTKK